MDEITVRRMLLTHTSDLPRYVMNAALWDTVAAYPGKVWSYHDRLSFIFNEPAVHEAGSGWSYSDSNYILIGMLIEQITGEPYYDGTQKRILEPAGLMNTYPGSFQANQEPSCRLFKSSRDVSYG
ncbi:MAG: serine hydrolase domain-containing protein [Bacteroidales bacterium]